MSKIFGKHFPMFSRSQKFANICQNVDEINTLYQTSMSKIFGKHFPMFSISHKSAVKQFPQFSQSFAPKHFLNV